MTCQDLYKACHEEGADVSIGSRYVSGVNVVNWPMGRVLMSYFASKYVRFITGLPIHDTTAALYVTAVKYLRPSTWTISASKGMLSRLK